MRVDILSDVPVSPNLACANSASCCAYPFPALLADGSVACLYRKGTTKHSYDGILVMQTSRDQGATWGAQTVLFDGVDRKPRETAGTAGLCQTRDGDLLVLFDVVEGLERYVYRFDEAGDKCPLRVYAKRSVDNGRSWSDDTLLSISGLAKAGIIARPFILGDGTVFAPIEYETPTGAIGSAAAFSEDDGLTFEPPVICAADPDGALSLCDARYCLLPDGRILLLLWTFMQENEETIEVRRCFSEDNGRTWTEPVSTGFIGQITTPLALATGEVIAVSNCRLPPEGIRLWYSPDGGCTWDAADSLQMWDAEASRVLAQPVAERPEQKQNEGVWEALARFSFGTPDLLQLPDGSILMTYYATEKGVSHIRACRFLLHVG